MQGFAYTYAIYSGNKKYITKPLLLYERARLHVTIDLQGVGLPLSVYPHFSMVDLWSLFVPQ